MGRRAPILAKHGVPARRGPDRRPHLPARLRRDRRRRARREHPTPISRRSSSSAGYPTNQDTGVSGLELAFNPRLSGHAERPAARGQGGNPAAGCSRAVRQGRVLATAQGTPGQPVRTTIDPRLQATTVNALGGQSGGVVVLNAKQRQGAGARRLRLLAPPAAGLDLQGDHHDGRARGPRREAQRHLPRPDRDQPGPADAAPASSTTPTTRPAAGPSPRHSRSRATPSSRPSGSRSARSVWSTPPRATASTSRRASTTRQATAADAPRRDDDPDATSAPTPSHTDLSVTAFGQGKVLATPLGMASVAQTVANDGVREPDPDRQGPGAAERTRSRSRSPPGERRASSPA